MFGDDEAVGVSDVDGCVIATWFGIFPAVKAVFGDGSGGSGIYFADYAHFSVVAVSCRGFAEVFFAVFAGCVVVYDFCHFGVPGMCCLVFFHSAMLMQ